MVIYLSSMTAFIISMVAWEAHGLNDFLAWGITMLGIAILTSIFIIYGGKDVQK